MQKAAHETILTADNLRKRKFPSPNHCLLCGEEEETVQHLFLITMKLIGSIFVLAKDARHMRM